MTARVMGRRQLWLALSLGAATFGGCECDSPPECTLQEVRFITPMNGATVGSSINVQVEGLDRDGTRVSIDQASLTVRPDAATEPGAPRSGAISSDVGNFSQVSLGAGVNHLEATVFETGKATCKEMTSVSITATTPPVMVPKVVAVTFPQDTAAPTGTLNSAEWPMGTHLRVNVAAQDVDGLQVQLKQGSDVRGGPVAFANGMASVDLDRLPETLDGDITVFAEILANGVARNTADGNPEAQVTIRAKRVVPMCENSTKLLNGPADDADQAVVGFQLRATGTVAPTVTQARFVVTGGPSSPFAAPGSGMTSADVTLAATGDQTYTVTLEARDDAGNLCTSAAMVRVDLAAPTVTITSPARVDGGNALVTSSPVTVSITSDAATGTACFFRAQGSTARTQVGCVAVANGMASLSVPMPATGVYELSVDVADASGNVGTASLSVEANLAGCGVMFTSPSACPATLFARDLVGSSQTYSFAFASPSCVGRPARLVIGGTTRASGTIGSGGSFGAAVPMTGGMVTVRAEVDNLQGTADAVTCTVNVDLSVPAITNPAPQADGGVVILNAAGDTSPTTPGAQRVLAFSAEVPVGGHADVCTTQATDPVSMTARVACADGAAGWYQLQSSVATPVQAFTFPEGEYSVKVVVVTSTTHNASPALPLRVDVTRPCLTSAGVTADRDNGAGNSSRAGDGVLNIAEYSQSLPFLSFVVGCGDSQATLDAVSPILVRQVVAGGVQALPVGLTASHAFASGRVNVNVAGLTGSSDRTYLVSLVDAAGNVSEYTGATDPAAKHLVADLVAPTCSITAPTGALLGPTQVPSGTLSAVVSTSTDVVTAGLALTLTGPSTPAPQGLAVANGTGTATFAVTGDATWTLNATCTDPAGNSATATAWSGRVDLQAPTCAFTAPTANATVATVSVPLSLDVVGADGRIVTVRSSLQAGSPVGTLTVMGTTASGALTFPAGSQTATAELSDSAGNTCSATVAFNLMAPNCNLVINNVFVGSSLSYLNRSNTTPTGATTATATVSSTSSNCTTGQTVTLARTVPTAATIGTQTADGSGNVSFTNVNITDGDVYTVTIDNGTGTSTTRSVTVDLVAPVATGLTINGRVVPSGTLYFVAGTANLHVRDGGAAYFADQSTLTANAQLTVAVQGISGAAGGRTEVLLGSSTLGTATPVTADGDLSLGTVNFTHGVSDTATVRIVDVAGNTFAVLARSVVVDVVAPGQTALTFGTPTRAGNMLVSWSQVFDDGVVSGGSPLMGYEVRWTTSAVPSHNELAAAGLQGDDNYFRAPSIVYQEPSLVAAGATSTTLRLPVLTTYYVAVRALDDVGNYAPFVAPPTANGSPAAPKSEWNTMTLADTTAGTSFGSSLAAGASLNGDAVNDLVVGAPTLLIGGAGAVYIYYGGSTLASQTGCSVSCQALTAPDGGLGQFGNDLSTSGDFDNDGHNDLVVGQNNFPGSGTRIGRAIVYFGTASGQVDASSFLQIIGDTANTGLGASAKFIGDIDGDGFSDLALSTPFWDPTNSDVAFRSVGRVYIFKGRARASWPNRVLTTADATWVVNGPQPKLDASTNQFSNSRHSLMSLGDFNGDGQGDFLIPMSRNSISRVQLWSGRSLFDPMAPAQTTPVVFTNAPLQTVSDTFGSSNLTAILGLGASGAARQIYNLTADAGIDLILSVPQLNKVNAYWDLTSMGTVGVPQTFGGTNTFGQSVAVVDLNNDGLMDVVVSEGGPQTPTKTYLLHQQAGGGFNYPDVTVGAPWASYVTGSAANSLQGGVVTAADITGDGATAPDLIFKDETSNSVTIRW